MSTADNHELLALDAFGLEPCTIARADIGSIGSLRDDAFQAGTAELVEQRLALADDMVGIVNPPGVVLQQGGELRLALHERQPGQILALKAEQIEGVEFQPLGLALDRRLQ
jgi:hypothetical protein